MLPRSIRETYLPLLLIGGLVLCHGVFGALHLVCDPLKCAGGAGHAAEHHPAGGAESGAHEHPAGHATGSEYFAVVAGLLGLLLGLLPQGTQSRIGVRVRRPPVLQRAFAVFHPTRAPTPPILQVFRL